MKISWQGWAAIILILAFIYATKGILLPFVAGLAVAYLLDPMADKLEEFKFPRWLAATTILSVFFIGLFALFVMVSPIVQGQVTGIIKNFPSYIAVAKPMLDGFLINLSDGFGIDVAKDTEGLMSVAADEALQKAGTMIKAFLSGSVAFFSLISLLLISPVVAFFLLRDWDLLIDKLDQWVPKDESKTIRVLATKIDAALAGFVRGQTLVSLSMAILYAIGWSIVGLDYALILGIIAGIMAYVPFVGALFAALIAILVGFGQFGADALSIFHIFLVFVVVQIIEAGFLTPRLIGTRVGLHPVWVLFAIFAGGEVMGFVGVLIAVPAAAAIGVLVRYVIDRYLESDLHKGEGGENPNK